MQGALEALQESAEVFTKPWPLPSARLQMTFIEAYGDIQVPLSSCCLEGNGTGTQKNHNLIFPLPPSSAGERLVSC